MKVLIIIFFTISFTSCLRSEMEAGTQPDINLDEKTITKKISFPSVVDLRNQIFVDTKNITYGRLKLVDNQSKKTLFQGNVQLLKKNNSIPIQGSIPSEVIVTLEKDKGKQVKVVRLNGNNLTI